MYSVDTNGYIGYEAEMSQGISEALARIRADDEELARQEAEEAAAQEAARAAQTARKASPAPAPVSSAPVSNSPPDLGSCYGADPRLAYIFHRESGCNPTRLNWGGCAGLGQACPREKLPCALEDVGCQVAWFTQYATGRYGSIEAAYQFWLGHFWW